MCTCAQAVAAEMGCRPPSTDGGTPSILAGSEPPELWGTTGLRGRLGRGLNEGRGLIQEVPNQRREEYLTSTPDPQLTSRRAFFRNWGATFTFPTTSCLFFHMSFTSLPGQSVTFLPLPLFLPPSHRVLFFKRSSCQHVWNIT